MRIFLHSRKIDTFAHEMILLYVLRCVGVREYDCHIQLFEDISGICVVESFVYVMNRKLGTDLSFFSDGQGIQIILHGKVVYETNIL